MKYFAKYLPVEGEIKEGDWITFENNTCVCKKNIDDYIECTGFQGKTLTKNWKKVKLFLCTKDIQVGDKVNCIARGKEYFNQKIIHIEGNVVKLNDDSYVSYKNTCYKVLGEISSEAIWVKEGDEFTTKQFVMTTLWMQEHLLEDISCNNYREGSFEDILNHNKTTSNSKETELFFKIQCPICLKYH